MHTEDLLVNDSGDWQTVDTVSKGLPQLDVISSLAFVIEPVDSVDRSALVISSEKEEVLWVLDLVGEEEADGFQRLLSSVYIIP